MYERRNLTSLVAGLFSVPAREVTVKRNQLNVEKKNSPIHEAKRRFFKSSWNLFLIAALLLPPIIIILRPFPAHTALRRQRAVS